MKTKIAIDVGGVLLEKKDRNGADTNFDVDDVKWLPGALDAVKKLKDLYDVYILSFCGKKTEMETREALRKFVAQDVPEDKWIFTRNRAHKAPRMLENGIDILIDDTEQIIDQVEQTGLSGMHFGGKKYKDWTAIMKKLECNAEKNINNESKRTSAPKLNDPNEFPPL